MADDGSAGPAGAADSASFGGGSDRPFLTWGDAMRAADAPGRGVPEAFVALVNALSNYRPLQIGVLLRGAEVLRDGSLSLWVEFVFGAPPLPGEESAGDLRRRFRVRVTADARVVVALGMVDPWGAARS